jgi:hypothetical protein
MVDIIACTPMRLPTKFGVSLPKTMPLPSTSSPKRFTRSTPGSVSGPAHELEQLHVADGVEEVHHEEALLERVGAALRACRRCAGPRCSRRRSRAAGDDLLELLEQRLLVSMRSMIASMTRSHVGDLREVVLECCPID